MAGEGPQLTVPALKAVFDDRSFQRGERYQKEGRVARGVRLPEGLWGEVWGNRDEPYTVTVTTGEGGVRSSCSCPVGHMCKHGAAVALQWLDDPQAFLDLSVTMSVLRQLDREELFERLEDVLSSKPGLLFDLDLALAGPAVIREGLDPAELNRWVDRALSGGLDYNSVFGVSRDLDDLLGLAGDLLEADRAAEAAEVCIRVFEGCVEALEMGADDSSGSIGTTADMSSELFLRCMDGVEDETFRGRMLERVLAIRELGDDYGLEASQMLLGIASRDNVERIVGSIMERLVEVRGGDDHASRYERREARELITRIYEKVGSTDDAMDFALRDMEDVADHVLAADTLAGTGRRDEALEVLRTCLRREDAWKDLDLASRYVRLVEILAQEGRGDEVDPAEAAPLAVVVCGGRHGGYDPGEHDRMSRLFGRLGAGDMLDARLREAFAGKTQLAQMLLHLGDVEGASQALLALDQPYGHLAMEVAVGADDEGMSDIAMEMTALALRGGVPIRRDGRGHGLLMGLVAAIPEEEIESLVRTLRVDDGTYVTVAEEVASRDPGLARRMTERRMVDLGFVGVSHVVRRLLDAGPPDAVLLGEAWVNTFVERHYTYYDDAVRMLWLVKEAVLELEGEDGWRRFSTSIMVRFSTRRRFLEKLTASGLHR